MQQPRPGHVVATVAVAGPASPKASELMLRLDDAREVRAEEVTGVAGAGTPTWLLVCIDRSGSIGRRQPYA